MMRCFVCDREIEPAETDHADDVADGLVGNVLTSISVHLGGPVYVCISCAIDCHAVCS